MVLCRRNSSVSAGTCTRSRPHRKASQRLGLTLSLLSCSLWLTESEGSGRLCGPVWAENSILLVTQTSHIKEVKKKLVCFLIRLFFFFLANWGASSCYSLWKTCQQIVRAIVFLKVAIFFGCQKQYTFILEIWSIVAWSVPWNPSRFLLSTVVFELCSPRWLSADILSLILSFCCLALSPIHCPCACPVGTDQHLLLSQGRAGRESVYRALVHSNTHGNEMFPESLCL